MNILVTGGSGFIGSRLIRCLLQNNSYRVISIDKVTSNSASSANFEEYIGSYLDSHVTHNILARVDIVIHLAGFLGVDNCESNPKDTLDINGIHSCIFFESCKRHSNIRRVLYTSSSEVYGDAINVDENAVPSPKSRYAIAKLFSESYLHSLASDNFKTMSFRLFSIYGFGQRPDFVIPTFVTQAIQKRPITVFGDGSQIRAFCHVTDAIQAIMLAISCKLKSDSIIFNIGNDSQPITMRQLAEQTCTLFKLDPLKYITYTPLKETKRGVDREVYKRVPNISQARRILKYEPKVSLIDGLSEYKDQ